MEERFMHSAGESARMSTEELRRAYLITPLFQSDTISYTYTHADRVIVVGVLPTNRSLVLGNPDLLKAEFFHERRECGWINIGGDGEIWVDEQQFSFRKLDCLYVGRGVKQIVFRSLDTNQPAKFYGISTLAHASYPTVLMTKEEAQPIQLGAPETSNERTIYKYIHPEGIKSCQLMMGLTKLASGSVWNSVPPHTHTRRMEVYSYFDLAEDQRILHVMGEPAETRHLVVKNDEAVISPPWSVHFGVGTSAYGFIWAMAGENQTFGDMDAVALTQLR